jgi:hypothetical protein
MGEMIHRVVLNPLRRSARHTFVICMIE